MRPRWVLGVSLRDGLPGRNFCPAVRRNKAASAATGLGGSLRWGVALGRGVPRNQGWAEAWLWGVAWRQGGAGRGLKGRGVAGSAEPAASRVSAGSGAGGCALLRSPARAAPPPHRPRRAAPRRWHEPAPRPAEPAQPARASEHRYRGVRGGEEGLPRPHRAANPGDSHPRALSVTSRTCGLSQPLVRPTLREEDSDGPLEASGTLKLPEPSPPSSHLWEAQVWTLPHLHPPRIPSEKPRSPAP